MANWVVSSEGFIKPFHRSTNPDNLVKISTVVSEIAGLVGRPLRIKEEKTPAKHIARRASNTGGLSISDLYTTMNQSKTQAHMVHAGCSMLNVGRHHCRNLVMLRC